MENNALKTVSKTDDALRVANYIVLFGGRDLEGIGSNRVNPDGTKGEYFHPDVDLKSAYTDNGQLYVDWEHGLDVLDQDEVLGFVDWKTARKDERGWFVERVLNRHSKYVQWLEELIEAGIIGNSTEAVSKGVVKAEDGAIMAFPLRRDTLTVTPMEPRMKTENIMRALKALHVELANTPETEAGMTDKGEGGNVIEQSVNPLEVTMEEKDLKALFDEQKTALVDAVKEEARTAAKEAVDEAVKALPEVQKGVSIQVTHDEGDTPFKSIGDNLIAVAKYTKGINHPRLDGLKALDQKFINDMKATGMNEGVPAQGGFLLEPTLVAEFLRPIHEAGAFSRFVRKMPIGTNSNYGWINGVDETSRAAGSRWGGVLGYWMAEAATKTASKPAFRRINWELKKIAVLQYATDELLEDAALLSSIISQSASEELDFMVNDAIYNGTGAAQPLGIMNSPCRIAISRNTLTSVLHADIVAMWTRLLPRSKANAVWFINPDVHGQLDQLTFTAGTTGILSPYVNYDNDGVMRIYGRPVVETEFNQTLGTEGDIALLDLNEYLFWERGPIEAASSIHVNFINDETVFRFVFRCDGMGSYSSAITPYQGTNTQSPFVTLLATT